MAVNARRFSQIRDDLSETSIAGGVFAKSRCHPSTGNAQDYTRTPKRRRTSGLNARFDNMVRSMDATYPGTQSLPSLKTRTRSSSNASNLSSVIADAYSDLHEGRIGENFTLVRMQPLTNSFAGSMQTQISSGKCSESTPLVRKDLPEWLSSTLSSLSEKHPLRLLLPNQPHCTRADENDHSLIDLNTDPTFAFGPDHCIQTLPNDLQEVELMSSDGHHAFSSVPRSPTTLDVYSSDSKDNDKKFPFHSATCGNHVPSTLDAVLFSTPGPNTVSMRQLPTIFKTNEVNERDPNLVSASKGLAFIPFSTPGPAALIGSYMATNSLPHFHASECPVDADSETRHMTTFPISHSRHTSSKSSAIDSCLPPYRAATSDPAPAYTSDGIYDDAYCADPSRDESGSEPRGLTDDDCANVFATPYRAPRFFDSPTEEPSELDRSNPGYEIDLDAIDFKWPPFNRKSVEEKKLAPCDQSRSESCNNLVPEYCESEVNRTVIFPGGSPEATPLPDFLPSPSPFRFTPYQLANTNSTIEHAEPQTPQTTKLSQPFAPAPGIYVSPLRDKREAQSSSIPRTPQNQIVRTDSRKMDPDTKTEYPSSQDSCDSIQSWRDGDENCP